MVGFPRFYPVKLNETSDIMTPIDRSHRDLHDGMLFDPCIICFDGARTRASAKNAKNPDLTLFKPCFHHEDLFRSGVPGIFSKFHTSNYLPTKFGVSRCRIRDRITTRRIRRTDARTDRQTENSLTNSKDRSLRSRSKHTRSPNNTQNNLTPR